MKGATYTKLVLGVLSLFLWLGCGGPPNPNQNNNNEPPLEIIPAPGVSEGHSSPIPMGQVVPSDQERPDDKPNDPSLFDVGVGKKWIGESCGSSQECDFSEGYCMPNNTGFPQGYCMKSCTRYCPDRAGKPFTFCVQRGSSGVCFSRCDTAKFPGTGCRPGYICREESRYKQSSVKQKICVPDPNGGSPSEPPTSPPPAPKWVGESCSQDAECSFTSGFCSQQDDGFPGGHCTQTCTRLCPDKTGKPGTFCVSEGSRGICVSQCDTTAFPGTGCRSGYTCKTLSRFNQSSTSKQVCVPSSFGSSPQPPPSQPPPATGDLPTTPGLSCYDQLKQWGVQFTQTSNPNTLLSGASRRCSISQPVRLTAPVLGVDYVIWTQQRVTMTMGCELAKRIARLSHYLKQRGITKVMHLGTYNCRKISGSSKLSNHSFGTAIDIAAFYGSDGTEYNLVKHWDHSSTWTRNGQMGCWSTRFNSVKAKVLYDVACDMWKKKFFSLILTPNYNRAHDNHYHVDLSSSGRVLSLEPSAYIGTFDSSNHAH